VPVVPYGIGWPLPLQVANPCRHRYGVPVNWRFWLTAVMAVSTLMTVGGCAVTVAGTPQRVTENAAAAERGYGYADERCGLLSDATVREIVGGERALRPYSGAVCQYIVTRHSAIVDVTYSWFEAGSLDRELALAKTNKAQVSNMVIQRREAFIARRSVTGTSCSATAATNPGVASWWVQTRGDAGIDSCRVAQALLDKTLSSEL
jgi:Protein of unknown function (DUF3558)